MEAYRYLPLLDPSADIRLITLLPATFTSDICLVVSHEKLRRPPKLPDQRMTLNELRKTLPDSWDADETLDGRYLFERSDFTFWEHPNPDIPAASYRPPSAEPHLGFQPRYEALSYTWGTSQNSETAFVQTPGNPSHRATLRISQNLADALRHLRSSRDPRTLWVDAICINQGDVSERDIQVLRMADIYRLAYRVVVWLGPEADDSGLALRTLEHVGLQVVASKLTTLYASPNATYPDWFRSRTTLPFDEQTWQAILCLVKRDWFDRVWIIQEIHLANSRATVLCGFDSTPWMQLRVALICLSNKVQLTASGELFTRVRHQQSLARNLGPVNLPGLLSISRNGLCTDPRDKVYGMLGLASEKLVARVRPQYSLSPSEVYRDTFLAMLDDTPSLNILHSCNLDARQLPNLPSWVPDWSVSKTIILATGSFASGQSRSHTVFKYPNILEVSGVQVATVREVKGPPPTNATEVLSSIRSWVPDNLASGSYPTGEGLLDSFAAALINGYVKERVPRLGPAPTSAEWKETVMEILSNDRHVDTRKLVNLTTRAFIIADTGHFGLGVAVAEPGDRICAVLGCKQLVILRPCQGTYEVVGTCSLHGFFDGEALLGPMPRPWITVAYRPNIGGAVHFQNLETGESTHIDPRLGPLESGWQEIRPEGKEDDFTVTSQFRNNITGEVMETDPRMLPDALEARGVSLEKFCLI